MATSDKIYRQQFENLFKENYQHLFYCALDIVNDEETAKDIVSEVFTDLWESYPDNLKKNMKSYLRTVVKNKAIDTLRHLSVTRQYEKVFLQEEEEWEDDDDGYEGKIDRIYTILESLSPKARYIFEQCYFQRRTYKDVAEELHLSVAAIQKHIVQTFARLRKDFLGEKK